MTVTAKQERQLNTLQIVVSIIAILGAPLITYAVSHSIHGERIDVLQRDLQAVRAERIELESKLNDAIREIKTEMRADRVSMEHGLKDIGNRLGRIEGAVGVRN
jgi:uncharacterized protein YPO0396